MKRLLICFMFFTMCMGLAGCGKDTPPSPPSDTGSLSGHEELPLTTPSVPQEVPENADTVGEETTAPETEDTTEPETESQPHIVPEETETPSPEKSPGRVIDPTKPMVALTFDDGPHKSLTPLLLDILEENQAVATFFEVGGHVWNVPEALVRMEEMGCEIGTHSNAHKDLSKMKKGTLLQDLSNADDAFIAAVGHAPYLLRPPYGAVNDAVKHETGRAVVTWDIDTNDWKTKDPQVIIDFIADAGNLDGKIVLMHSTHASTVEAMKTVIPQLIEDGYQLVTVTELFAYYYGEVPQQNHFYGYTYFHKHGKTDTPAELPETYPVPIPPEEKPAPVPKPPVETPPAPAAAPVDIVPAEEVPAPVETPSSQMPEPVLPEDDIQAEASQSLEVTSPPDTSAASPVIPS